MLIALAHMRSSNCRDSTQACTQIGTGVHFQGSYAGCAIVDFRARTQDRSLKKDSAFKGKNAKDLRHLGVYLECFREPIKILGSSPQLRQQGQVTKLLLQKMTVPDDEYSSEHTLLIGVFGDPNQ